MKNIWIAALILIWGGSVISCKEKAATNTGSGGGGTTGGGGGGTVTPTDPATANTIGFFINDWQTKNFALPAYTDVAKPTATATSLVTIDAGTIITKVPPSVYGHNANSWMGDMVNDPVLLNHITNLKSNIIRFPGGSISDVYFWNALPGLPPADAPATLVDANGTASAANYWVGKNTANWTISLDKYYTMLAQTGNQGMITVNYAYARYSTAANPVAAAAHLAADWVRYDNGRTKYWEIGNECNSTGKQATVLILQPIKMGNPLLSPAHFMDNM